jgi:hypothetical protein
MSGRVTNSGYIPPVSSKRALRRKLSELRPSSVLRVTDVKQNNHILNRSATPGKYQTGSTAALLTLISTPGSAGFVVPSACSNGALFSTIFPSTTISPLRDDSSISLSLMCALVIAILGRMSSPVTDSARNTCVVRWPHGSKETILLASNQAVFGGISTGGSVLA